MPITGHAAPHWENCVPPWAREELILEIQDQIIAAELIGDELALAGIKRCYIHVLILPFTQIIRSRYV